MFAVTIVEEPRTIGGFASPAEVVRLLDSVVCATACGQLVIANSRVAGRITRRVLRHRKIDIDSTFVGGITVLDVHPSLPEVSDNTI